MLAKNLVCIVFLAFRAPSGFAQTNPAQVYRGDTIPPGDLKRQGGFIPKGMDLERRPFDKFASTSLYDHVNGDNRTGQTPDNSGYVSTSSDINVARRAVQSYGGSGYIYYIRPSSNFIDADGSLGQYHPRPEHREHEFSALWGIDYRQVVGWLEIIGGADAGYTSNPDFDADMYLDSTAGGIQPELAGFIRSHPAWLYEPWRDYTNCNNHQATELAMADQLYPTASQPTAMPTSEESYDNQRLNGVTASVNYDDEYDPYDATTNMNEQRLDDDGAAMNMDNQRPDDCGATMDMDDQRIDDYDATMNMNDPGRYGATAATNDGQEYGAATAADGQCYPTESNPDFARDYIGSTTIIYNLWVTMKLCDKSNAYTSGNVSVYFGNGRYRASQQILTEPNPAGKQRRFRVTLPQVPGGLYPSKLSPVSIQYSPKVGPNWEKKFKLQGIIMEADLGRYKSLVNDKYSNLCRWFGTTNPLPETVYTGEMHINDWWHTTGWENPQPDNCP